MTVSYRDLALSEMGLEPRWVRRNGASSVAAIEPAAQLDAPDAPDAPASFDQPAEEKGIPIETMDWESLQAAVGVCPRCRLCATRKQTVFGVGEPTAKWMLIGEAPGAEEDAKGEPFVGPAGRLLDNMLASIALSRQHDLFITNVLKCRPPGNRNPAPDEVRLCEPYLLRQIALIQPRLIVVLGRFAAQSLLSTDASIASLRGKVHQVQFGGRTVPVVVTYHPAYLLRSLADKSKAWADLCLIRGMIRKLDAAENSSPIM